VPLPALVPVPVPVPAYVTEWALGPLGLEPACVCPVQPLEVELALVPALDGVGEPAFEFLERVPPVELCPPVPNADGAR
jgi:hypothetical protein